MRNMKRGFIGIGRPSLGDDKEVVVIRIGDTLSHSEIVEVHLSYRDFTLAITGMGHTPCEFETRNLDRLGKVKETKTEEVLIPADQTLETPVSLLAPFETDGWKGCSDDLKNHHRRSHKKDGAVYANVTFVRYVKPPAG